MSLVGFKARNHPQQKRKDHVDDRAITLEDFAPIVEEFGPFTLDAAASTANARCSTYYDLQSDGLASSWAGRRVWCNPPYSDLASWVAKAWEATDLCPVIVMLLPANRPEQRWWQDHIEPFRDRVGSPLRIHFLPGRMRFLRNGADEIKPNERPPFGCCLAVWGHS